jgi:hypothetical protein
MADQNNQTPNQNAPQQQPNNPQRPAPDQQQQQGGERDKNAPAPDNANKADQAAPQGGDSQRRDR